MNKQIIYYPKCYLLVILVIKRSYIHPHKWVNFLLVRETICIVRTPSEFHEWFIIFFHFCHYSIRRILFIGRVIFLRISCHIKDIKSINGAFDKFLCFTYFKKTIDFLGLHFDHWNMTFSVNHIYLHLVEANISHHCLFHPTWLQW